MSPSATTHTPFGRASLGPILALLVMSALFALPVAPLAAADHSPLYNDLIGSTAANTTIPVIIYLDHRLTMDDVYPLAQKLPMKERRTYVVNTLKARFNEMSPRVMERLEEGRKTGEVTLLRPLWILNAIRAEVTPAVLKDIDAHFSEVTYLGADPVFPHTLDEIGWGVEDIRAPDVWSTYNVTGNGVIVGHKDTGENIFHPSLAGHIWINSGEDIDHDGQITAADSNGIDDDRNGYVDDFFGWNFDSDNNDISDNNGHGTETGSVIAGGGQGTGTCDTIGVAPGAKLMVLRSWQSQGAGWEASQYAVEMGANVLSQSFSFKKRDCLPDPFGAGECPNYVAHRFVSEMELAAGVIHANSTGNEGTTPLPFSTAAPATSPPPAMTTAHVLQGGVSSIVSVAAYEIGGNYGVYSGHGPCGWSIDDICVDPRMPFCAEAGHGGTYPPQFNDYPYHLGARPGLFKPDIAAPTNTRCASRNGGCSVIGGTSGATPHVGGALALICSAFPGITPENAYLVLVNTAEDAGPEGPDSLWGFGKLRPFPACSLGIIADGTLMGNILGSGDAPVPQVRVSTTGLEPLYSDASGGYHMLLSPGNHDILFHKFGYDDFSTTVNIILGQITRESPVLTAASPGTLVLTTAEPVIPIRITDIPLDTTSGDNGTVSIAAYAGTYTIIYGALPWKVDTLLVTIPAGETQVTLPLHRSQQATCSTGPDHHGYRIYDNYDNPAVTFDWVEINPDLGHITGDRLFTGAEGTIIQELPFTFRFYGSDYASISVTGNGFLMMGDNNLTAFTPPTPLPSSAAPFNYFAPYYASWDASAANGGKVFYYSQPDSHRVIVEWSGIPTYFALPAAIGTFEIILYDPAFVTSRTGDGVAKFQYNELSDRVEGAIGLENSDGTDGIQYAFQLQYDSCASPIVAGRALLITTDSLILAAEPHDGLPIPQAFVLEQNYPNPFNPTTTFTWSVPRSASVRLTLYDLLGRQADVIFDGLCEVGQHSRVFDASHLSTGIYFARLEASGRVLAVRKVMLLK
jgi:hypothetical protein